MKLYRIMMMEVQKSNKYDDNRSNICIKDKDYVVANISQSSPGE